MSDVLKIIIKQYVIIMGSNSEVRILKKQDKGRSIMNQNTERKEEMKENDLGNDEKLSIIIESLEFSNTNEKGADLEKDNYSSSKSGIENGDDMKRDNGEVGIEVEEGKEEKDTIGDVKNVKTKGGFKRGICIDFRKERELPGPEYGKKITHLDIQIAVDEVLFFINNSIPTRFLKGILFIHDDYFQIIRYILNNRYPYLMNRAFNLYRELYWNEASPHS